MQTDTTTDKAGARAQEGRTWRLDAQIDRLLDERDTAIAERNSERANFSDLAQRHSKLKQQRDELLEACKAIIEVADSAMWDRAFGAETIARFMARAVEARQAIAHATEKEVAS